jgi:hypothetical protein
LCMEKKKKKTPFPPEEAKARIEGSPQAVKFLHNFF